MGFLKNIKDANARDRAYKERIEAVLSDASAKSDGSGSPEDILASIKAIPASARWKIEVYWPSSGPSATITLKGGGNLGERVTSIRLGHQALKAAGFQIDGSSETQGLIMVKGGFEVPA